MTKADKMFEKIGYIKDEYEVGYGTKLHIDYYKECNLDISIEFCGDKSITKIDNGYIGYFTPEEIQIVNKKCKELGWLE